MSTPTAKDLPARIGWVRNWPHWAPYAALVWSLVYSGLGLYWAVSGRGFPYAVGIMPGAAGPLAGRFGLVVAWIIVIAEGLPAVAIGALMLRGVKRARPLLISAGVVLAGVLLLLMTDITLLILLGYIPYGFVGLLTGAAIGQIWQDWLQWPVVHQWLCLIGGFLWLAATLHPPQRRCLPVLWTPGQPGRLEEP